MNLKKKKKNFFLFCTKKLKLNTLLKKKVTNCYISRKRIAIQNIFVEPFSDSFELLKCFTRYCLIFFLSVFAQSCSFIIRYRSWHLPLGDHAISNIAIIWLNPIALNLLTCFCAHLWFQDINALPYDFYLLYLIVLR